MADLLKRIAQRKDVEAFKTLFEAFAPRVKSYMMRQGADPTTAEDLAQEAMLTVWRKAALYSSDKGQASTWIFTIARNLRIDRIRRQGVFQELPDSYEQTESDEAAPDEAASLNERQARVRDALDALPPEQREMVELSFIEGLSHSEIAERTGLALGTVKSRLRLAYQKLRDEIEDLA
jgi:RNA polymerase sigma-70 factor (ECF subfamily)